MKLRSTSKGSQSPSTTRDAALQTITTAGPATANLNEVVIGPCCDCNRILLDGLYLYQNVTLSLFSSTPNSTVPVTLGHGGPGRIGFSLNLNGPWVDSLDFNVNTDSNGTGSAAITFYIKGLDAGQSNMTTTVASGFTNPVPQMEVFACQCRVVPDSIAEAIFDRTGGLKYHKTWTPNYYNDAVKGCCNSAARWPEQLLKMQDIPKGELWRDWTLKVDWIFKYNEPYTLWP